MVVSRNKALGLISIHLTLCPISVTQTGAYRRIQVRQAKIFYRADTEYGKRVAEGLGLDMEEIA